MSDAGFGNRGNRDASVVNIKGMGQIDGTRRSGPVGACLLYTSPSPRD